MRKGLSRFGLNLCRLAACSTTLLALAAAAPSASVAAVFERPTNSGPIQLSRDDRLLFVVNPRDDTLSVVCTKNGNIVATIGVGDEPRSVAVDPNNKYLFVANTAGSTI